MVSKRADVTELVNPYALQMEAGGGGYKEAETTPASPVHVYVDKRQFNITNYTYNVNATGESEGASSA